MAGLDVSLSSSKFEETERVNKANAWMEEAVEEFTSEEMTWWNAKLGEATSNEVDEIVKLYEYAAAAVDSSNSLNPIITQYICKYWEGSYGQQKPDHLLLAAYRAGLHLKKSSALKLFSDTLMFIGRASYQEECPNRSGGLVLVLIKQMEMLLSVAGWCLASDVISKEQYASIVGKLFSDQHGHIVELVYCISNLAVTCVVEEDLTRTDELVLLRCHNLYEVIYIEMSYTSARAELSTTTIKDKEEEEIFGSKHDNEKASSTEVEEAFATSSPHAYKNEEINGKDGKNKDTEINRSFGLFKSYQYQGWNTDTGRVEADCGTNLLTTFDAEHLNNGVSFNKHQYLGVDRGRGDAGQRSKAVEYILQVERKDLRSLSRGKCGLGLGCELRSKGDLEVSNSKGMKEMVWKWIISIGVSVVSIGKWFSKDMPTRSFLKPKDKEKRPGMFESGGFSSILLFMMLLAPPPRHFCTLAMSEGRSIRHRSLSNSSFVNSKTAASPSDCRQPILFDWGGDNPYTHERKEEGKKPLTLAPGCEEKQRCLFMPDDLLFNVIAAEDTVFPVFENLLSERSPSIEQLLANAKIVYDGKSMMNILGIGTYKGSTGIGEYRVVPQFLVDYEFSEVAKLAASPSSFSTEVELVGQEKWSHLDQTQTVNWNIRYSYYPCSVIRMREDLEFPLETAQAFSDSGKVDGKVESVCKLVMEQCTGKMTQYNTTEECISYLGSLPHHDPTCQDAFGEYSAMGNSFMCKYLHHFMIPFSPDTHCAHAGKGLPDANGNYKCVASDCREDKANQITGLVQSSSSCSEEDLEELVQGIIYALPFCLPSLEMQVCMSNCTQAINTYLGRFAESGVIDSCGSEAVLGSSRLLSLISVDAHTLFHICKGDALLAANVASAGLLDGISIPTCSGVNQYIGTGLNCLGWDWDEISQGVYAEWRAKYKGERVTQSDDIATAECHVFTLLYTQYLNIQYNQIVDDAANSLQTNIQIHPNGHPIILSHEHVSMAFEQTQSRDDMGVTFGHCAIPGKIPDWMQDKHFNPVLHDTNSTTHNLARQLVFSAFQGLKAKPIAPPARDDLFDEQGLLDYDELLLSLQEENFRALLGDISSQTDFFTSDVIDMIRNLAKTSLSMFFPESWHRGQGYLTGVAYASQRQTLGRKLRDKFKPLHEEMKSFLPLFNVSASEEYLVYDFMINVIFAGDLVRLTQGIIRFIRQDPCHLLPLWNSSPERFVVEYTRLHAPVPGFGTHSSTSSMGLRYQVASASRDPEVFLNPLSFDPDRLDLDQVLSWNFIEGEGPSSHARSCPARSYTVQFAIPHAERYFPNDVTCANNMKVHNGVELFKDNVNIADGSKLQVLKTSTSSSTLFLFLHGFPDIPQEFAPIISHLQTNLDADYWMLNGWSTSKCKITEYAEQVASLISESKARFQYEKVFLVGHGYGGLVGWVVAGMLSKDVLSGFVSFSPSPQIFAKSLVMFPATKVPFYNLMKPLAGSTYLSTKNFQLLDDLFKNEAFWPEYRDEYHQMWDEVGARALTCVYRENFDVVGGILRLVDLDVSEEDIETDVLLISGEDDVFYPRKLYHASIGAISPQRGQRLSHNEVHDASHRSILHEQSQETSHQIEMFARSVNRKQTSLWSRMTVPPQVHNSYDEEVSSATITFYVYILTFVVMLTGVIMELTIGTLLVGKLGFGVYLFAQVMAATINFGCFFSANLITLPLYTVGLFKMGYPEVTGHIIGPIRSPEFYFDNKPFRVMSFISGIAYVVHHAGATIVYTAVCLHEMSPLPLGFLVLAVGFQHLIVFVKYRYMNLYSFLLIGLEVWFQLESYYALTFATASVRVGVGMVLCSHYVWLVHGIMQTSLKIFINNHSAGKMEDEEDPNRSETETEEINRRNKMSGSVHKHKEHSLRLYSSIHSTGRDSEIDLEEDSSGGEQLPLPASSRTQRRGSLEGIGEVSGENECDSSSKPTSIIADATPRARFQKSKIDGRSRSVLQSRSSMLVSQKSRLFDSNEVMHLMGFVDENESTE